MNNIMPQMIGDGVTPGLWPDLAPTLGANSFRKGNEKERWKFFFESGSAWATELELEIRRVKDLRNKATRAAGLADPPRHSVFDEPEEGFGAGADKLHRLIFDDIREHEARALAARARTLMPSDQRRLAFQQSSSQAHQAQQQRVPSCRSKRPWSTAKHPRARRGASHI